MESEKPRSTPYAIEEDGVISKMSLSADETYLHIDLELNQLIDFSKEKLIIGLDTYDRARGDFKYNKDVTVNAPTGLEYVIEISGSTDAQLLVQPGYNATTGHYTSTPANVGVFEKMTMLINKESTTKDGLMINPIVSDLSQLAVGTLANNSHNAVSLNGKKITIRIPWT